MSAGALGWRASAPAGSASALARGLGARRTAIGCAGCTNWKGVTILYELYNILYNIVTVWFADEDGDKGFLQKMGRKVIESKFKQLKLVNVSW